MSATPARTPAPTPAPTSNVDAPTPAPWDRDGHPPVSAPTGGPVSAPVGGPWVAYFGERGATSATPYAAGYTLTDVSESVARVRAAYPGARVSTPRPTLTIVWAGPLTWVWRAEA